MDSPAAVTVFLIFNYFVNKRGLKSNQNNNAGSDGESHDLRK